MNLTELEYRTDGPVAVLTMNRPEKLNAMSRRFWPEMREVVAYVAADDDVRVLVITGAGKCFSVGGDIDSFGELGGAAGRRAFADECLVTLKAFEDLPKPTIAAVHGYALGGGCELTMVADLVVADETAQFGTPETAVGLFPGLGVVRGRAHVNLHLMKELVFLGERFDAHRAAAAGIVNTVVPAGEHVDTALAWARTIATKAPLALQAAKRILNRGNDDGYAYSVEAIAFLHGTADQAEGVRAFAEKRSPEFRGA
jgi:enoyl-CoA hydratase/carnithine racemase